MKKMNCWEFKKCGRQPGGDNVKELGTCPSSTTSELDGTHGGFNAGRSCWIVKATLCGNAVQGSFAAKHADCFDCEFYKSVAAEEGLKFIQSSRLMLKLKGK